MQHESGAVRRVERFASDPTLATWQILAALPAAEWSVLASARTGLTAHIAVGPQGVFVIDPRPAPRWLRRDELRPDGVRQDVVVAATGAAVAVSRLTGLAAPFHVHPVLCFVGRDVELATAGDVFVCSTSNLLAALTSKPAALDQTEVRLVALELDASLGVPASAARRSRRWFGPQVAGLLLAVVASVGLWQAVDTAARSDGPTPAYVEAAP